MVTKENKKRFMENSEKVPTDNELFTPVLQQIDNIIIQVTYHLLLSFCVRMRMSRDGFIVFL